MKAWWRFRRMRHGGDSADSGHTVATVAVAAVAHTTVAVAAVAHTTVAVTTVAVTTVAATVDTTVHGFVVNRVRISWVSVVVEFSEWALDTIGFAAVKAVTIRRSGLRISVVASISSRWHPVVAVSTVAV